MAVPVPVYRIDLNNDGDFGDANEDVTSRVLSAAWTRGASATFAGEATGALTLILSNDDAFFDDTNMLPGLPVHVYATYAATDRPRFFGYVKTWSPDHVNHTVRVTCYDVLQRLSKTDVVVPANGQQRTGRDFRLAILSDFERGNRNLIGHNPSFETNTTGWSTTGAATITRFATDHAPPGGTAYGAFVSTADGEQLRISARLAPVFYDGETYRWSVYLKVAAGTASYRIGISVDPLAVATSRTVTVTTTWTRFTIAYTLAADIPATSSSVPVGVIEATAAGTVRVDCAAFTRGQVLYPYSDLGTGRWPNWVGNGNFEAGGGSLAGWTDAFHNLIPNGNFETNATGWTNTTRDTGDSYLGSASGVNATTLPGVAPWTESAISGVTYRLTCYVEPSGFSTTITLGSTGTPADSVSQTITGTGYQQIVFEWTPSANRADAALSIVCATGTYHVDAAVVIRVHEALAPMGPTIYIDSGIGGGTGSFTSSQNLSVLHPEYGHLNQSVGTPATAGAGRVYDFYHLGPYFVAGQQYAFKVGLRPSSDMPYKVGMGAATGTGGWDEATPVTGTALANVWTDISGTWTPSADRSSSDDLTTLLYVIQTDATARTFETDGVRVNPGATTDEFEMARWDIPGDAEVDAYLATASYAGSALSGLSMLNDLTLSRHFIRPTMTTPFYEYVVIDRDTFAALTSQETFTDDPAGATTDENSRSIAFTLTGFDIDENQIRNVVHVTWDGGEDYYGDEDSVGDFGPEPAATIGGSSFFIDRTVADQIGPALVTRYKDPHARLAMTVERRFPSQLVRELGEVITLVSDRAGLSGDYVILREDTSIVESGLDWATKYALETFPY